MLKVGRAKTLGKAEQKSQEAVPREVQGGSQNKPILGANRIYTVHLC